MQNTWNIHIADTFFKRLFGLMWKKNISITDVYIFPNCYRVHTFFMRMPIDILFLNKNNEIICMIEHVKPWRIVPKIKDAITIVEVKSGFIQEYNLQNLTCINWAKKY